MADDNIDQSKKYTRREHPDLSIESIISAPLVAISKANVLMVTGQAQFLLDYCFIRHTKKEIDPITQKEIEVIKHYEPVLIDMIMSRSELQPAEGVKGEENYTPEKIKIHKMSFTVPLISIIPMNSLVINKFNLDFELQITSTTTYNTNEKTIDKRTHLNGKIGKNTSTSTKSEDNQSEDKISKDLKVNIDVGQLPLPKGLLAIIDLYTNNIQPSTIIEA